MASDGTVNMRAELLDHSITLRYLSEAADDHDTIELPYGTGDEARRAIIAFEMIVAILPDIAKFNAPDRRDVAELEAIRLRLRHAQTEIRRLTRCNVVYEWLGLAPSAARALRTLEDEAFPFPHLRDENLMEFVGEDITDAFCRECRRGRAPVLRWLDSLGGVDGDAIAEDAFRHACWYGHITTARWLSTLGDNA
jgi:hypothetical protein